MNSRRHGQWAILLLVFVTDVAVKFALGIGVTLMVWLPFGFFGGCAVWPWWLVAGTIVGAMVNGFLEGSDVFGIRRLFRSRD